ncbi:hypothetical protein DXZ79_19365 [Yersinia rochesterensis]|uniref:Uncharacterized protein n=1 Tax=Yersinia rochesterensis TaxID=1604335 RepID=A0A8D4N4C3_9GAMM|nr:hypothetical protein DXZ79_19365 [Yersinia rochesterensis]
MCVDCFRSPQSLTYVSSWGFTQLPPSCNSNYLGYRVSFSNNVQIRAIRPLGVIKCKRITRFWSLMTICAYVRY